MSSINKENQELKSSHLVSNFITDHPDFTLVDTQAYPNGGYSYFFENGEDMVIVDIDICQTSKSDSSFSYMMLTEKQNKYMKKYAHLYRFLGYDREEVDNYIAASTGDQSESGTELSRYQVADRSDLAEASALEKEFETNFSNAYGRDALKFLNREYGISDDDGNSYFFDFCVDTKAGKVLIEENGVSYHHPQIVGPERYAKLLKKQNTSSAWGMKLYRFSTEECQFDSRMEDDIRTYIGENTSSFRESGILVDRKFHLYDHQKVTLDDLKGKRDSGIKACLVVLPTASGKSKIAELDMKRFADEQNDHALRALILAPNTAIIDDWKARIHQSLPEYESRIDLFTNAYMCMHYSEYEPDHYDYICIDEAHHAVAPAMKRVIQHFDPLFLLGMTATDERMDHQKLDGIFGTYNTRLSLKDAMESGIVAMAKVFRIETNIDLSHVRFNGKDYINADLEKSIRVTSRNELIASVLADYFSNGEAGKRQGIIFCVNIQHCMEMTNVLNKCGFAADSYTGKTKKPEEVMKRFKSGEIRFLCTCSMISEGWDYPELGIIVMARPTLSKVLYLQQIGRGLRRTDSKKDVFVIDVVDDYGTMVQPCTMHSIFKMQYYVPFGEITRHYEPGDFVTIDGLEERVEKIIPVNIDSFDELYGQYLGKEQIAREYFVGTETITSWIQKKKINPTVSFQFGSKKVPLFSPEDTEKYRIALGIGKHDDSTIKEDFFQFLEERTYALSYKMTFILSFLHHHNDNGEANISEILQEYCSFYENRINRNLTVDRSTCPFTLDYLKDEKAMKRNLLDNPFKKFERKRFFYYSKDLSMIAMNHALYDSLEKQDWERIEKQMNNDLSDYYRDMGGI